jgi:hypothetical protein
MMWLPTRERTNRVWSDDVHSRMLIVVLIPQSEVAFCAVKKQIRYCCWLNPWIAQSRKGAFDLSSFGRVTLIVDIRKTNCYKFI